MGVFHSSRPVGNYVFFVQSVTLAGLSDNVPHRCVKFQGQSVTFTDWVLESGNFITDRP